MTSDLKIYKKELTDELAAILEYWMMYSIDERRGGFYGRIDNENKVDDTAPKGSVLNARILWSFAAAYNYYKDEKYLKVAQRAFNFFSKHFIDNDLSGVFWTVDYNGKMLDSKKQVYALAFGIYGLSEYYVATKNKKALELALSLHDCIEHYSFDKKNNGYLEAFTQDWKLIEDMRLSEKDANEKKTMNTHLHIIEAYANLYKCHPSEHLKNAIANLLDLFNEHFINKENFHLRLFFDELWNEKINVISYGHDIEAAWLLLECAKIIHDEKRIKVFNRYAVKLADAILPGVDTDGGVCYEYNSSHQTFIKEKHWWVQAEAMVGFFNAYQISNNKKYLRLSIASWKFIKHYIIDSKNGEWFWGVKNNHEVMQHEDKVGLWKCPYHNSRSCLEIIKRLRKD